jgi:pyruvate, water dikinase
MYRMTTCVTAVVGRGVAVKTDEYANLLGGAKFEPKEANPMIGWRGGTYLTVGRCHSFIHSLLNRCGVAAASRYYDPRYRDGFALECEAVKRVREQFGLTNLQVMIPFCRTVAGTTL